MMNFEDQATTWNELGKQDPFWAILTHPEMEDGQWAVNQFFLAGQLEIETLLEEIEALQFPLVPGRVLDFGCGVGRLSQALSSHFDEVHGVDVAPSMIDLANSLNQSPATVTYHVNQDADLKRFGDQTFDCIYSRLVLQHINPVYARQYIAEFMRVLKPGGLAVFQVPHAFGFKEAVPVVEAYLCSSARFLAQISAATQPLTLAANEQHALSVRVQNRSQSTWLSAEDSGGRIQINLANHWLRPDGHVFLLDGSRSGIPLTMTPGDAAVMELTVTAPPKSGAYLLELDLVQEQTAWFGNRGSPTVHIPVDVSNKPSLNPLNAAIRWRSALKNRLSAFQKRGQPVADKKPRFEMHAIPAAEVLQIVANGGGHIVAVQHDGASGQDWQGFLYFVTKEG